MRKRVIILANGNPPAKRLLQRYRETTDMLVCADGGANTAAALSLLPDLIIGDLDSISPRTLKKYARVRLKKIREQNTTDLEKALSYAVDHHCSEAIVFGATGGRADHEFGNFSALAKFAGKIEISFVDQYGEYFLLGKTTVIQLPVGTTVSLLPLTPCDDIVTNGLKWNLCHEALGLGLRESTSNLTVNRTVSIACRSGRVIMFISHAASKTKKL